MARKEAEIYLQKADLKNGGFIVRNSESSPGDFSLSVKYGYVCYTVLQFTYTFHYPTSSVGVCMLTFH